MKKLLHRLKTGWDRFLERLAASNKELYGNRRPDCCSGLDEHHRADTTPPHTVTR
jgi:hypothetical protein